jgi:S-formylglutathione hydrolase FrmB
LQEVRHGLVRVKRVVAQLIGGGLVLTLPLLSGLFVTEERLAPPPPTPLIQASVPAERVVAPVGIFTEHGEIVSFTLQSAALGSRKKVNIYLPPGYAGGEYRYPVIYLLRGHEGEWLDGRSSPSRKGRNAAQIADELIMSGAIAPVILAMPSLTSADGEINSLGINLPAPERAAGHPGVGPGRFGDFLVQEVLPAVDERFRTLAGREFRGVDGFSLGGFAAVSLALRRPDLFASVGAYEPSFLYPGGLMPGGRPDPTLKADMPGIFGDPPDLLAVERVNPFDLIAGMSANDLRGISFHLQSAPPGTGDHDRVALVLRKLAEKGVANSFTPQYISGSKHGWYWADEHLKQVLPKHAEVFARGARVH